MPPRRRQDPEIFVAKVSFSCELDGAPIVVNKGERVRTGHPLLRSQGGFFEPVDSSVHYDLPDVEQATAAPGEKRGA